MKTPPVVAVLAVLLAAPCVAQSRVPADLQAAMKQRADAIARDDTATWNRLTTENFSVVLADGEAMNKVQRLAQMKSGRPSAPTPLQHETVQMYGNTAVQRYETGGAWVMLVWSKGRNGWRVNMAQATDVIADSASVQQAIDQGNARFLDSFKRGDANALASNYADSAVVMEPNTPAWEGVAAIKQGFTQMMSQVSLVDAKLVTHDVVITLGEAIERGTYQMTMHMKSGTAPDITDSGKYLTIWEQQGDGSWKIIRDISNSDRPTSN